MTHPPAYTRLLTELRRLDRLSSSLGILFWDEQTNMPPQSAGLRGEQTAALSELVHRESTRPELGELLGQLKETDLDEDAAAVVREARKAYNRSTCLPGEYVARAAAARSAGFHAWVEARKDNDFARFAPHLEKQIELAREGAHYQGAENVYDHLIDSFDPGMTSAIIDPLFAELEEGLRPILGTILASGRRVDPSLFKGFPEDKQEVFLREVVTAFGFDFGRGRIDRAIHPFCGGHPEDTRMTTRYDPDNPLDSITSAMHETGHALYEQGLKREFAGTALGSSVGMAVHESQSRLWENQVGRSRAFWQHWEPRYRELFPEQLAPLSSADLHFAINRVAITPIRVDADEVTYNLHILLRYHMERDLFSGKLSVKDVPGAWNARSTEILRFTPETDREGCLQDVHWSEGLFGYFPSYTLGNLLAAQLWYRLQEDLPDVEAQIGRAEFMPLLEWLRTHVHSLGRRYYTQTFAQKVTGSPLTPQPLLRYLRERYLPLYSN